MADFERGLDQFSFLYENREPCNTIAVLQLGVTVASFIFTYPVWWSGIFGIIVGAVGYYGSVQPVIQSKVSFVQLYYFGNCFLLVLECFTFIILVFLVTDWKPFDGWAMTLAFVGSAAIFGRFYIAYQAMCRSGSYRAELMRNPPPAENIYAAANSYTAMGNGYKAPMTMTEIKTI